MSESYKILLVDDEKDILEFLSYNLQKEGFTVFTANNGAKGLELAKTHIPDLIILDVMMPEMDGIEACQNIRNIKELDKTLVLFLTARSEEYSDAYHNMLSGMVERRMRKSITSIGNLWYSAWVDAGQPILDGMQNSEAPFTEEIKIDHKITKKDARGHQY